MYCTQYTASEQDIIQHIYDGFIFPENTHSGSESLFLSRDFGSVQAIQSMMQIHNLIEQIAKSEQPAVKFETTIHGKRCLGFTSVGEALYQIVRRPYLFDTPIKQQLSEHLNLWNEVALRILDRQACFSGDPIRPLNDQGVTEGELLNAMLTRLGEGTRSKAYQLSREQRRKETQSLYAARRKLIAQLLAQRSGVFGMRVELMYHQDHAGKIRVNDSAEHIQGLIEVLKEDVIFGASVGNFWTRSFLSEASYRTTLFLLFDLNTTPSHMLNGTDVLQQWEKITKNTGLGFIRPDCVCNVDQILHYIECSKQAALYLRLKPDARFPHFGISKMPSSKSQSALAQDRSSNFGNRGGFVWNQTEDLGAHLNSRF